MRKDKTFIIYNVIKGEKYKIILINCMISAVPIHRYIISTNYREKPDEAIAYSHQ